ncbi:MAG TPA: CoA pyrophosphatase [Syntrophales bacterium]|nr:CoA pyrophosphatase [Syntrophales bacterium]HNS53659.1 CoA pyrophosphatase [Syntrophales bacterium]
MPIPELADPNGVVEQIIDRLGNAPIDYEERVDFIRSRNGSADRWLAAGVILLLHHREAVGSAGGFVLQLIKRSSLVPQPGDLSCPGGMLHPAADRLLRHLVASGLTPILRGRPRSLAKARGGKTLDHISLFLTNALREAWEEIRINPLNVRFLGALPSQELYVFSRVIFPVVGLVRKDWTFRPNREVERVIEIPLTALFDRERYGTLTVEIESVVPFRHEVEPVRNFPCFLYTPPGGHEEVLWGATLSIVLKFLDIAFGFTLPAVNSNRVIRKFLRPDYATGNHGPPSP